MGLKVDIMKLDVRPGYPSIRVFLGSTPGNSNLSIPVQPYVHYMPRELLTKRRNPKISPPRCDIEGKAAKHEK